VWAVTDITDRAHCERLADTAIDRFGQIDALVNCAALDAVFGGLENADWDSWRQALEINLFGTMQMTQAVIPHLKERGGSIVFIGSQAMYWSQVAQAAYAASKSAILGAVAHLARELGPYKIRVNTVVPSWMWGPPVEAYVDMTAKAQNVDPDTIVGGITEVVELTAAEYRLAGTSATFHGRDLFAPAAAHLALGIPLNEFGPVVRVQDVIRLPEPRVQSAPGTLETEVHFIDRFGNVALAARHVDLASAGITSGDRVDVAIGVGSGSSGRAHGPAGLDVPSRRSSPMSEPSVSEQRIRDVPIAETFSDVGPGELVTYIDSSGQFTLAVNQGNAAARLNVRVGDAVTVERRQ
jgi:NAD(P)-dependent dehydrogenase (short-subunit alcohol dehydrogenase family)